MKKEMEITPKNEPWIASLLIGFAQGIFLMIEKGVFNSVFSKEIMNLKRRKIRRN